MDPFGIHPLKVAYWTSNMETRLDELSISSGVRQCFLRN